MDQGCKDFQIEAAIGKIYASVSILIYICEIGVEHVGRGAGGVVNASIYIITAKPRADSHESLVT